MSSTRDLESDGAGVSATTTRTRRFRLPRSCRLRQPADFRKALDSVEQLAGKYVVVCRSRGDEPEARVGVIASKRTFPRSVDRSRAKRLLREAFRLNRERFPEKCDLVLIARRRILTAKCSAVELDLIEQARRIGALKELQGPAPENLHDLGKNPPVFRKE